MGVFGTSGKYESNILPNMDKIAEYVENGLSQEQIAKNLGVAYSTFREYVKKYPALSAAIKKHAHARNEVVENSLYKRATGGTVTVKKLIKLRRVEYDEATGKKKREYEELAEGEEEQYIPPDTAAQIFWLTNNMGNKYTNRPQELKISRAKLKLLQDKAKKEDW